METFVLMPYQESPFNGDFHVQGMFLELRHRFKLNHALETGSCLYSTTEWLGKVFDKVSTVEINGAYADAGKWKVANMTNVGCHIGDSVTWLREVIAATISEEDKTIFFLDAYWGDVCPLLEELEAISELKFKQPPVIVIHDFYTGNPELGYDEYKGQPFTWEWIEPSIKKIEAAFNCEYEHAYNTEAAGAKRGVVYITPKI